MSFIDKISDFLAITFTLLASLFYVVYPIYVIFQHDSVNGQFAFIGALLFGAFMGLYVVFETSFYWWNCHREWFLLIQGYFESFAVAFLTGYLSFFILFFLEFLVTIPPALTAVLVAALIAVCAYLAIKWFAGSKVPEAPPIQSDDAKLDALAEAARAARAVVLDTSLKPETKENRNVYSGAR